MGQYMSYIGEAAHPVPYAKVDLLGLSLGILAGVLPPERAHRALAASQDNRDLAVRARARGSWTMRRASPPKSAR